MRAALRTLALAAILLSSGLWRAAPARADGPKSGAEPKLGTVHFATSCTAQAQTEFDRSMAYLHSFWVKEALAEIGRAHV
jgi:hypothetical protein